MVEHFCYVSNHKSTGRENSVVRIDPLPLYELLSDAYSWPNTIAATMRLSSTVGL
jgi:hypothetical protein